MRRPLASVSLLIGITLAACDAPGPDCVARGVETSFTGSAMYSGQTGLSELATVNGAVATTVTVYDATEDCTYDGMEFTVGIGTCLLWARSEDTPDGGTTSVATIEPGQTCPLRLAPTEGVATVQLTNGVLSFGSGTASLTLAGNVGDAGTGYLQWSFVGE